MYTARLSDLMRATERDYNLARPGEQAFIVRRLADGITDSVYLGGQYVLGIKTLKSLCRLIINYRLVDDYADLHCLKYKEYPDDKIVAIDYPLELCDEFYDYINIALRYSAANYMPSTTFACCSRYRECSAARKCLHNDLLLSKGCWYRDNIERGKILY